jgi:outer membrane translocation and assembly module TamA
MSKERKQKRSIIDELFGSSLFDETEKLFEEFPTSGYSISVVQTPEGTKVKAKVGKNTDVNALRKQLERQYPNARIEIEGGKKEPLIREISTKNNKNEE